MSLFNRTVVGLFLLILLIFSVILAVAPLSTVKIMQSVLKQAAVSLEQLQATSPTNFIIGQATLGIAAVLILGILFWLIAIGGGRRGAIIRTIDGSSAELDVNSIGRRLEWHLEQIAEVSNVVPIVKARGGVVDIRLEVEVHPDVDIPMKTDEVVISTRDVIEDAIGLKLGKLDVRLRCAPIESAFIA